MREPPRSYSLYPEFLISLLSILHLFHLRKGSNYFLPKSTSPVPTSCLCIPTRLSYNRFTYAQIEAGFPIQDPKKREIGAWKGTPIHRVNAINEFVRITCLATISPLRFLQLLSSPLLSSRPLLGLRYVCPSRPTVRVFPARGAESVAINWPLALTVDAGHDIRNVARIQCFRALDGSGRFHPCRVDESVARRNQFRAQIPYLRARRNRRFELIVDEPSRALFLPPPPSRASLFFLSHNSRIRALEWSKEYLYRHRRLSGNEIVPAKIAKNLISIALVT